MFNDFFPVTANAFIDNNVKTGFAHVYGGRYVYFSVGNLLSSIFTSFYQSKLDKVVARCFV